MINEPQEPSLDGQGRGRLGGMVERRALTGKSQGSSCLLKTTRVQRTGIICLLYTYKCFAVFLEYMFFSSNLTMTFFFFLFPQGDQRQVIPIPSVCIFLHFYFNIRRVLQLWAY